MKLKMKPYRFAVIAALCTGVLTACSGGTETSDDVGASVASDNPVSMETLLNLAANVSCLR